MILDPRQPENGTYGLPVETAVDVVILPNTVRNFFDNDAPVRSQG